MLDVVEQHQAATMVGKPIVCHATTVEDGTPQVRPKSGNWIDENQTNDVIFSKMIQATQHTQL